MGKGKRLKEADVWNHIMRGSRGPSWIRCRTSSNADTNGTSSTAAAEEILTYGGICSKKLEGKPGQEVMATGLDKAFG